MELPCPIQFSLSELGVITKPITIKGIVYFLVILITGHIWFIFPAFLRSLTSLKNNHVHEFSFTIALLMLWESPGLVLMVLKEKGARSHKISYLEENSSAVIMEPAFLSPLHLSLPALPLSVYLHQVPQRKKHHAKTQMVCMNMLAPKSNKSLIFPTSGHHDGNKNNGVFPCFSHSHGNNIFITEIPCLLETFLSCRFRSILTI